MGNLTKYQNAKVQLQYGPLQAQKCNKKDTANITSTQNAE